MDGDFPSWRPGLFIPWHAYDTRTSHPAVPWKSTNVSLWALSFTLTYAAKEKNEKHATTANIINGAVNDISAPLQTDYGYHCSFLQSGTDKTNRATNVAQLLSRDAPVSNNGRWLIRRFSQITGGHNLPPRPSILVSSHLRRDIRPLFNSTKILLSWKVLFLDKRQAIEFNTRTRPALPNKGLTLSVEQ